MATERGLPETRPEVSTQRSEASGPVGVPLGERLRELRIGAGLTQTDLAGGRFSKEYLSQIERGKTRPTGDMLAWLAERLGIDASFLETGQSSAEYAESEAAVARAEAAVEGQQFDEAREALNGLRFSPDAPELEFRALMAESWTRSYFEIGRAHV